MICKLAVTLNAHTTKTQNPVVACPAWAAHYTHSQAIPSEVYLLTKQALMPMPTPMPSIMLFTPFGRSQKLPPTRDAHYSTAQTFRNCITILKYAMSAAYRRMTASQNTGERTWKVCGRRIWEAPYKSWRPVPKVYLYGNLICIFLFFIIIMYCC